MTAPRHIGEPEETELDKYLRAQSPEYENPRYMVGNKLVSKLLDQELSLTQKISLQERLLQMSESKKLSDVEISPQDQQRLRNSLERDKLKLAGSRPREKEINIQKQKIRDMSTISQESEEYAKQLAKL